MCGLYVFHAAIQAAGVIAFAFYWLLLFAITLIELVCKEIKAMLKQMSCEIHTNFSDYPSVVVRVCLNV